MDWGYDIHTAGFDFLAMNTYDRIAGIYDFLAGFVFFGAIAKAKRRYLSWAAPDNKVLIVGGGTGKVLCDLNQLGIPLAIDFVEPSGKMIKQAKRRASKLSNLNVNFIQSELGFLDIEPGEPYDFICTFFFLDLFEERDLVDSIDKLGKLLKPDGFLFVSDFQIINNSWWQKALSAMMHWFFRMTTSLQSSRLKEIKSYLCRTHFIKIDQAQFFCGFIFSAAYKKNVSDNGNHL